ncbi:LysR family transcriptional regulator [Burkholderia gladioli]|uniref:LysR family transcriptional regulator n=1 Tax=Burkholderia gladioli TaxID=28095 RepID=UPI0003A910AF|nr:LysR family transcriptional regulator [Burkholderia gladioli]NHH80902.1 HTH-type transcriptional regulator PgrR [Burkholderia gladioli]
MLDRLELLTVFAAAAKASSFRDAARRLGVSPQVVTRAIRELEQRLGETLFHRNTRRVQITAYGQWFAANAQTALAGIDALFDAAGAAQADDVAGTVRLTAPGYFGRHYVMPILMELARRHPGLTPDLRLSDTPSAVVDERIDIGVRAGSIGDNRFVAREVGPLPIWVVGAPGLIERASGRPWPWLFSGDTPFQTPAPVFVTDDVEAEIAATRAGLGFSQCAEYLVRPQLENGRLVRVLRRFEPQPWKLHVYRPQRGPVPRRIRVVFDALVAGLAGATWRG